jgi:hypothetical protein
MYNYRIGELKNISAELDQLNNPAAFPQITTAKIRLYNANNQQVWERPASILSNVVSYLINDLNQRGLYTVQWVVTIGSETLLSDPMKLQVKSANEV